MIKIAFVGMERTGKTTLIYDIASTLSKDYSVSSIVLNEITWDSKNLLLDLDSINVQMSLMFEQMSKELLYTNDNKNSVLLVDRTPIDILMYLRFLVTYSKEAHPMFYILESLALRWMSTYSTVYVIDNNEIKPKINTHFTRHDLEVREIRKDLLLSYTKMFEHIPILIGKNNGLMADLLTKEITEEIND